MPNLSNKAEARRRELNLALEALHFAFRAVVRGPDVVLAELGLSRVHHRILYFIARDPGLPVNALLTTLGVTKQALNAPLRQLTKRGFVCEALDAEDRRIKHLHLTTQGQELEERLSGAQREQFARVFKQLGRTKEQAWHEVMSLLASEGRAPRREAPRRRKS